MQYQIVGALILHIFENVIQRTKSILETTDLCNVTPNIFCVSGMAMNHYGRGLVRESGEVTQRILDSARNSPHSDLVKSLCLACAVPYLFYSGQMSALLGMFDEMIELQQSQRNSGHTPIVFAGVMQSVSASAFWPTSLLIAGRVDEAFAAAQQVLSHLHVMPCVK